MKKLVLIATILLTTLFAAEPVQAGFRIGPRFGVGINRLHFGQDMFSGSNRLGFTGGVQAEITLPLGFSVDGSVMYVRRSVKTYGEGSNSFSTNLDYVTVPLNLKWTLGLPEVKKFISPYVFTGPDFAFLANKEAIKDVWSSKKFDMSWNFGVGVQLFRRLLISASYGVGLTEFGEIIHANIGSHTHIEGKNNNWTISTGWMF